MVASNPFQGPEDVVAGVREQLPKLLSDLREYSRRATVSYFLRLEPGTETTVAYLKLERPPVGTLHTRTHREIRDMRAALDQAMWAAANELGGTRKPGRLYFPIRSTEDQLEGYLHELAGHGVHAGLLDFVRKLRPHQKGDPLVVLLADAANHAHQKPIVLCANPKANMIADVKVTGLARVHMGKWNTHRSEVEFARCYPGGSISVGQVSVEVDAMIVGPDGQFHNASGLLHHGLGRVDAIVQALKAETARLKALSRV